MFCSKCGNQVSESALFCNQCGAQVKTNVDLKLETQMVQSVNVIGTKCKQTSKKMEKLSVTILAIASLLSLVASIVIYICVWVSIFNQPYTTVHGWTLIIISGVANLLWLMILSAPIVNSANLVHKKIIIIICALWVINVLYGIVTSILDTIDLVRVQSDTVFVGSSFEIVFLKNCLGIVFSVTFIVACILTVYTAKKQKEKLAKILLVFFVVYIIYVLVPLLGTEMRIMRWQYVESYFRIVSARLRSMSMCLFWVWLLVRSRQQTRQLL